jgi:hypothetical protein
VNFALPGGPQYIGQPRPSPEAGGGISFGGVTGTIPVRYARLGSLPRQPAELLRYLDHLNFPHRAGWGPPPAREFTIIQDMMTSYVMPPG